MCIHRHVCVYIWVCINIYVCMLVNKYVYTCLCMCVYTYMWNIMLVDLLFSVPCTVGLHCMVVITVFTWEAKPRVWVFVVVTQCPAFDMELLTAPGSDGRPCLLEGITPCCLFLLPLCSIGQAVKSNRKTYL